MRPKRRLLALPGIVGSVLLLLASAASLTSPATAQPRWAPERTATIKPGVQMFTRGAQCTANFVFTDRYDRVYVGYAAHCAGRGSSTSTDGCRSASYPLGTRVRFASGANLLSSGATRGYGRLAYSSWITMRRLGVRNPDVCENNDFALVRVEGRYAGRVNPTVPHWGGPMGLDPDGVPIGTRVFSYGSSSLSVSGLSPKQGTAVGQSARGWHHDVYTAPPGIPGDSGAAYLDAEGRAIGTLSTLAVTPLAGSNGVSDLLRELWFAQRWSGIPRLGMVKGTRAFRS